MTVFNGYIAESASAELMFRLAVEACPNGMVMIDGEGKMVLVNTEIEQQFGYSREELIGQPVDMLVPTRMREQHVKYRRDFTPRPEKRRMGAGRELFGLRKDGTEFPVEVGLNPIHAGDRLLVLSVIVDISQRKQMERLKEEFVSTVSHELRTPLTSIAGSLGLLVGHWSGQLPESAARLLTIAHNNSQRLVRLINDILDIEKIESGRVVFDFTRVDVGALLQQTIEDTRGFAEGYGVQVVMDPATVSAAVSADSDRLAQVVVNLLSNAIKYSPASEQVTLAAARQGNTVRITVRDRGTGIPQDFRSRIFEKFAQADGTISRLKGGTGLGLSIVKQIVERLGGQVGFEDASDVGTIFYVDLPLLDESEGGQIDVEADPGLPRLLLCEDDLAVAKLVRIRLGAAGFAVDFAQSVATALTRTARTRYSAFLVDLRLRDGEGIDLVLQIRAQEQHRETPIVVLSGDPQHGAGDVRASRLNILGWLGKPIDFGRLTRILQAAVAPAGCARPRILHVDDDKDVLARVARELFPVADVISAESLSVARRMLVYDRIDLAVVDARVGAGNGLDLLPELHDRAGNPIPVVMFSACAPGTSCAEQLEAAGPSDAVSLERLSAAVRDRLALLPRRHMREVP
jgi:PAS domain S-box-containing protein